MSLAKVTFGFLHPGHVATCFMYSVQDMLFCDAATNQRLVSHPHGVMGKQCGAAGIVDGRNDLARALLDDTEADWLFMVDADMGFAADTLERLIDAADALERPVVGGLAFAHKKDGDASFYGLNFRCVPTVYRFHEDESSVGFVPVFDYPRDELTAVSATGGACLLVHRLALQKVRDRYGDVWFDTIRHPKGAHFSEDLAFCVRLAACDVPIYVHTGIKTVHDKGGVFYDEAFFDRQEAARGSDGTSVPRSG